MGFFNIGCWTLFFFYLFHILIIKTNTWKHFNIHLNEDVRTSSKSSKLKGCKELVF